MAVLLSVPAVSEGSAARVTSREDRGLQLRLTPDRFTVREVESGGRSWRRIESFGSGRVGEPGRPDLPVQGFWIAVPPGHTARARVVGEEHEDLVGPPVEPAPRDTIRNGEPRLVPAFDRDFYGRSARWPDDRVTVGEPARFRHQDLVPLRVSFFEVDPAAGILRVYRSLEIEVVFLPDPAKGEGLSREPAPPEEGFERLYQGTVVNYEQGRGFRSRSVPPPAPLRKSLRLADEYKIRVAEGGFYRIDLDDLRSAGFPEGTAFSNLALYRRGFDDDSLAAGGNPFTEVSIPFHLLDGNGDGLFGGGDFLAAWLPGFREDRMKADWDDRYDDRAVYFLSVEGSRRELETRPALLGHAGLTPLPSFPDSVRWEVDGYYNLKAPAETLDLYFPMGEISPPSLSTEILLPAVDASSPYGIKAMTVGATVGRDYHRYLLTNEANGDTVMNEVVRGERGALVRTGRVHAGSGLGAGSNRFLYYGFRGDSPGETNVDGAGGFLDWYEVHADYLYQARGDYLLFSNGAATGPVQMELRGFTSPDVLLFDLEDPYVPVRVTPDSVRAAGGTWTVVFQDSVSGPVRYAAALGGGLRDLPAGAVEADGPSAIASGEADYVIIAHDDFVAAAAPLAEHRSKEGKRGVVVAISDVYDEFHGGPKDVRAIRRYLEYAFLRWSRPPYAALLVGDGYEDYRGIATNSLQGERDFIPSWPTYRSRIEGSGDHWDVSDVAYVTFDGIRDPLPEILIGRFPAMTAGEVSSMVEKTIAYESFTKDDGWRSRAVFIADDAWTYESGPIQYVGQTDFELNSAMFSRELKETAARGIDTVNVFLSRFTDVFHPDCPYLPDPTNPNKAEVDCTINRCRGKNGVTDAIFSVMNGEGAGLINFQGHGNRNVLTHEIILRSGYDYRQGFSLDIRERTKNEGRPYIFMAYGCSISEFERFLPVSLQVPYRSLPEEMMTFDEGAAVAVFGSSGIEYLRPNLVLNESVLKYFFQTPGVVPGADPDTLPPWYTGIPRWTLGEMFYLGLMDFVVVERERVEVTRRYILLGDPALAVDARPPAFEVTVGGEPAKDGDLLVGNADGTPVRIVARIHDEVVVDSLSLRITEGGVDVDRSLYTVVRDDSLGGGGRAWVVTYEPSIRFGEYDIVFRAVDGAGREGTFTLRVAVDVTVTFDGMTIRDGDYVSAEPEIRATITTPVPVLEEEIEFRIDGASLPIDTLRQIGGFRWVATATPRLSAGEHTLVIDVQGLEKSYRLRVADRFRIVDLLNYPNPSEGATGFYYHLTDGADRVRAEIYTLTGKRIRVVEGLSGRVGYNANEAAWNGEDQDGDPVANGVYLYKIVAGRGGEKAESIGKAVVARP